LSNIDWDNLFNGDDVNSNVLTFYNVLYEIINAHTPVFIKKDRKTEPWLDRNLRTLRNRRNKLLNK